MRTTTRVWGGIALVVALTTAGCGTGAGTDEAGDGPAQGARVEVLSECVQAAECTSLDPGDFAGLAAEDGVVLLDVRTPEEYAAGHLEGARNIDVSGADFANRVAELDPAATYAVYCRSGNRSQTAMALMREAGVPHAADLAGGIVAWVDDGRPVTTG